MTRWFRAIAICVLTVCTALFLLLSSAQAITGPALSVNANTGQHPISPYIYGINFASAALADAIDLPVRRWGGNATTRYHYLYDVSNRGSDWYFENIIGDADPAQLPNGSETDVFIEQDRSTGTKTILNMPLIGWAPSGRNGNCGFSISKYGAQQDSDWQWRPDCGNGVSTDGTYITSNDPLDTSVAIGTGYIQAWLGHLIGKYGNAANGGVLFYNLDNEPDLWHETHRDVHPLGASYDELRDQGYLIGAAIKATDPNAQILGPVGWGYLSLLYSGKDQGCGCPFWSDPPDRNAHGGIPFGEWYLQQMKAYEDTNGVRILDYYDNHIYPQQPNVFSNNVSATTQAVRLRSTRQLWDPTYIDNSDGSWIDVAVNFIPRVKQMIANNYPGTKMAITEYSWGAQNHINGALAQADVLGIFGREGVDLATLWAPPTATEPGAFAFRIYRNYDGLGSKFGDTSVTATSANQSKLAIYAALRSSDGALTLVIINKDPVNAYTSTVSLAGFNPATPAKVYRYNAANLTAIVRVADQAVTATGFSATFPAYSITLIVIPKKVIPPTLTPVIAVPTNTPDAAGTPTFVPITANGLQGQYFNNMDFTALMLTRFDPTVNFNWGTTSPYGTIGADTFSVRWRGFVQPQYSQTYTFYTNTNDGVRLWVDNQLIIDAWVDGNNGGLDRTGTIALMASVKYEIKLEYYDNTGGAKAILFWSSASQPKQVIPQARLFRPSPIMGLRGEYFNNADLTSVVLARIDPTVNFNWITTSPHPSIGADTFSVRWQGFVQPQYSQTYTFYTNTNDGVRLWVNNQLIIDGWVNGGNDGLDRTGTIALTANVKYSIKLEYYDNIGDAKAILSWSSASQPKQVIPQARLFTN